MDQREYYYNHIFVDETMITLRDMSKYEWTPIKTRFRKYMKTAHSAGIIVYAGISRRGLTPFIVLPSTTQFIRELHVTTVNGLIAATEEFLRTCLTIEFCNTLVEQARTNIVRSVEGRNWEGTKATDRLYV
uniref:Transposase n=1 Tax=Panagrolaimus davidi TaxID=227884 RepID=A0A914QJ98_9BILA